MNSQIFPLPTSTRLDLDITGPMADGRKPIGEMLVEWGRLEQADVQRVLDFQVKAGLPFGEAGIAMGLLDRDDVDEVLAVQFGQPAVAGDSQLSAELVAARDPNSPAVENLRALRSQLMLRWFENDARQGALAVVSPGSGEGRSWMIANLAVLFSQLGKRTLLIDADLRHPRQHQIFGLPGRIGLSAVLAGRAGWEAVCEVKALPDLFVLPAGAVPPNPQELLARPGFAKLLAATRSNYEVILVDTPAAGSSADASTIAARAGAALVLACQDASSMGRVAALADELRQFGVTVVGAVLNGSPAA
ncbi:MAG: chain length determinant protein tyrosine kinase EpsG [Pseudomonadota bacterium]